MTKPGPTLAGFPWNADCDEILARAERLDPSDRSLPAEQLRETAASIRDHRDANPRRD